MPTSPNWRVLIGEHDLLLLIWFAGRFSLLLQRFCNPVITDNTTDEMIIQVFVLGMESWVQVL